MFPEWPADPKRIEKYKRFRYLYEGDHNLAFAEELAEEYYDKQGDELTYIKLAYPALIVNIAANLLVGEPPIISYPKDQPKHVEALRDILDDSDWKATLIELCQESGAMGDAVLVVRQSARRGVVIEPKPAYCYYPQLDPDNCREVLSECLAWEREWNDEKVLRVDHYHAGSVRREAYGLDGKRITEQFSDAEVMEMLGGGAIEIPTGVSDRDTLVHLPNLRSAKEYFGYSDYDFGIVSLFEEANNRITQIAKILDKHASPLIASEVDIRNPENIVNLSLGWIKIPKGANAPEYIVWNAELKAAFEQLKLVLEEIYRQTEISPVLAGYIAGASYDSGRAFRMQFVQTLAKMARKRSYLEPVLKEAIRLAVAMKLGIKYADALSPEIKWRDGLPKDLQEAVQTESTATTNGLTSKLDAIMRLWDCDEDAAQAILDRVEAEQSSGAPVVPQNQQDTPDEPLEDEPGSEGDA